jgi:hypothetical protein
MRKIKTVLKALIVILLSFVVINLASCDKKNEEKDLFTDKTNDFYPYLKVQCQKNPGFVNGIEAYVYNNIYYFDADLFLRAGECNYNYLLVFKMEDNFFNKVNEFIIRFDENEDGFEVDVNTLPKEYNDFLEAKEKGKKKVYTKEEIETLKNNF